MESKVANETSPELDALLERYVEHTMKRTGFKREDTDKLVAAGLVKVTTRSDSRAPDGVKRVITITGEGHRRCHDLDVEKKQKLSMETVVSFVGALKAALAPLTIDAPEPWDTVDAYLAAGYSSNLSFDVVDAAKGGPIKVRVRERQSAPGYSVYQSVPLHQWDITVGDWTDYKKFRSRKGGMPLAEVVDEVQRLLTHATQKVAQAVEAEAKRGTIEEMIEALHAELGRRKNDVLAHLVVESNGDVRLVLPRFQTFEQAEALLRAAKKVGL